VAKRGIVVARTKGNLMNKFFEISYKDNQTGEIEIKKVQDYTIEDCLMSAIKIADFSDKSVVGIAEAN
jgi:transcription antitermination factor NusA-like protein